MASINPYLNFRGTTEEAFNFYKSVFGGEFITIQRFNDIPEAKETPEEDKNKIMHISLPIGGGNVLMGSDTTGDDRLVEGNNFHISINADSEGETARIFNALAEGGKVTMPLAVMFWGAYFGMLTDRFGIQWMVNYDTRQENNG
ncbi:MAG: hypothetical protein JWN56_1850 [Sphingobacteriales bacterium]|nr:hypothetical protein [Sphingobacteriales bacterium]